FAAAKPLTGAAGSDLNNARLMDLYGTARPELVVANVDDWSVFTLSGNQWRPQGTFPGSLNLPLLSATAADLDINGDGRTDVISATGSTLHLNLNSKNGFTSAAIPPIAGDPSVSPQTI